MKEPDTDCPLCWRAEASFWLRARVAIFGRPAEPFAGVGKVMLAAIGARTLSQYEKHRADWERTGHTAHLKRMLRHVDGIEDTLTTHWV